MAVANSWRSILIMVILGCPLIVMGWMRRISEEPQFEILYQLLSISFLIHAVIVILRYVFSSRRVSGNTIAAAMCVYLLLGLVWAIAYSILGLTTIGDLAPFSTGEQQSTMRFGGDGSADALYFSFVTLTTLGYGDTSNSRRRKKLSKLRGKHKLELLAVRGFLGHLLVER